MKLSTVYQTMTFQSPSPLIQDIVEKSELIDFVRTREGKQQVFHFSFSYKGKTYLLHHRFFLHGKGVSHWFSLEKPWLSFAPFRLTNKEYQQLSDQFMKAVNEWNRLKKLNELE